MRIPGLVLAKETWRRRNITQRGLLSYRSETLERIANLGYQSRFAWIKDQMPTGQSALKKDPDPMRTKR
jgi:hypothetical protein